MLFIRIPKKHRAKAFRPLVIMGPYHVFKLAADDPVYVVSPVHLQVLDAVSIPFEVVPRDQLYPKKALRPKRVTKNRTRAKSKVAKRK